MSLGTNKEYSFENGWIEPPTLLGVARSMCTNEISDNESVVECPTCGRTDFSSVRGMKHHHSRTHGESIAGVNKECELCGSIFNVDPHRSDEARFCSNECQIKWQSESGIHDGDNNSAYKNGYITLVCEWCSEEFEIPHYRKDNRRFCDKDCRSEWMSEYMSGKDSPLYDRVTLNCSVCGDEFDVPPSHAPNRNCCSRGCMGKVRKSKWTGKSNPNYSDYITNICCECGDEFDVKPSASTYRKHCSQDCYSQSMMVDAKKFPYDKSEWRKIRSEIILRDDEKCSSCSMTREEHRQTFGVDLHVHHIQPIRTYNDTKNAHSKSNLITLCASCHRKIEIEN